MNSTLYVVAVGVLALALGSPAQAELINPPTKPQMAPMTAQEKKNLDMVLTWWRVSASKRAMWTGRPSIRPRDYIQHNPNINTGRAGFVAFFTKLRRKPIDPIPASLPNTPVVMGAKGDFVWLIFETEAKDPRNPANTYHSNTFDVMRIQNGKVQEHWDSAQKVARYRQCIDTGVSPKPPIAMEHRQALQRRKNRHWRWQPRN